MLIVWAGRGILMPIIFVVTCLPIGALNNTKGFVAGLVGLICAAMFFAGGRWLINTIQLRKDEHFCLLSPKSCLWVGTVLLVLTSFAAMGAA